MWPLKHRLKANLKSAFEKKRKQTTNILVVFSPSAEVTTPPFKMRPQKGFIWDGNVCRTVRGEQELPKVYLLLEKVFLCQRRPRLPPPPSRSLLSPAKVSAPLLCQEDTQSILQRLEVAFVHSVRIAYLQFSVV